MFQLLQDVDVAGGTIQLLGIEEVNIGPIRPVTFPDQPFPEFRHALVRGGALCLITVETGGNHRLDAAVIQNAKGDAYMPFKLPGNRINNVAYPFQVFS